MLLHAFLPASRVNGPGMRAVVFIQGCLLNCPRCWNPQTHPFRGIDASVREVARMIADAHRREPLEGVTFSGGEPMHHADALADLMAEIRAIDIRLSLGMFTGYTEAELATGEYFARGIADTAAKVGLCRRVRSALDFAVMGRYDCTLPIRAPLRTSANQRLVLLFTDRYKESDFGPQSVEINIAASGAAVVTGFPVLGIPA